MSRAAAILAAASALLLLCAAPAASAPAASNGLVDELRKAGATRYLDLVSAAKATEQFGTGPGVKMVFVPTNQAVDAWLKEHSMAMADIQKRKAMANRIVGYSIVRGDGSAVDAIKPGSKAVVATLTPDWGLTVQRAANGDLSVRDADGDLAPAKAIGPAAPGGPRAFLVDTLLLPGNVFSHPLKWNFDVMMDNGTMATNQQFEVLKAALARAGLKDMGLSKDITLFAPTDAAFKAAGITADAVDKMPPAEVLKVLQYHAVEGYHPIPAGLPAGKPVPTLLKGPNGSFTTLTPSYAAAKDPQGVVEGTAFITDGAGGKATVLAPNWFSGKITFHAIDKVLSPSKSAPTSNKKDHRKLLGA